MQVLNRHTKISGYLVLVAITLIMTNCGLGGVALPQAGQEQVSLGEPFPPETQVYFRADYKNEQKVQLWQTTIDGSIRHQFLELPTQYPIFGLPIQELALLEHEYCSQQEDECTLNDISLHLSLGELQLSPDKQWLVWKDSPSWCPGSRCYGLQRFILWNVSRGERQVLLEIPNHMERFSTNLISRVFWSKDSKEIAFVHSSFENTWSLIRVISLETKQIRDIGDGKGPIAWSSNDSNQLAFFSGGNEVKIASRDGTIQTTIDGNWVATSGIDWSPDSSKLVITAATEETWQEYRTKVFIADLNTGDIIEVDVIADESFSYSDPQWSPNGQWLGVHATSNEEEIPDGLLIIDPADGSVKSQLTIEQQQLKWHWSDTSDAILLDSPKAKGISIFYWQENRLEELPLPGVLEEGVDNGAIIIIDPAW